MSVLRSFRKALACAAYFVSLHAAAAQQIWLDDAGTLRAIDVASSTLNAATTIASAQRFSTDSVGRLWVANTDSLIHLGASGVQDVLINQAALGLQGVVGLAADPFDGTAWIADSARLVHVGLDGQVIGGQLLPEALSDLVVAPDQTLWVLGDKDVLHYDVATAEAGRLIESIALSRLPALPSKLFVDALRKNLWLQSGQFLSRIDLANGTARTDIALASSVAGTAFDPFRGWAWILTGKVLAARDGSGAIARTIDLPAAAAGGALIAFDPYGQSAWLQVKSGLVRVDIASGQATRPKLQLAAQSINAVAGSFLPSTLIAPVNPLVQAQNASLTSLQLALSTVCSGRACTVPLEFLAGLQISGTLNGQPVGSATIDAANQKASFSLAAGVGPGNAGTLIVVATDPFGHVSNQLTMRVVAGRIVASSISSQGAPTTSGSTSSNVAQAKALGAPAATPTISQPFALDSPALVPPAAAAALSGDVSAGAPLQFEVNVGQHHPSVKFSARSPGFDAFVSAEELVFVVTQADQSMQVTKARARALAMRDALRARGMAAATAESVNQSSGGGLSQAPSSVVRIQFVGANPAPTVQGMDALASRSNYLMGKDHSKWRAGVAQYKRAGLHGVYNGIDAIYSGANGRMEYDFVVAPGADPSVIRQRVVGADSLTQAADGSLLIHTTSGEVRLPPPVLFQPSDNSGIQRRQITGAFQLTGANEFVFNVGPYDKSRVLVIDPTIAYKASVASTSSPIGLIAVDSAGSSYVAGQVNSASFTGGTTTSVGVHKTFYIQKLAANGSSVLWTTFIGGSGASGQDAGGTGDVVDYFDIANAIAVDSTGAVYVAGSTDSSDFPTTTGALEAGAWIPYSDSSVAFIAKLTPAGNAFSYSTCLGLPITHILAMAVDLSGNAYVTGYTSANEYNNFPSSPGAASPNDGGSQSGGFVTKLNAQGSAIVYSSYVGSWSDAPSMIAVDAIGNAYIGEEVDDIYSISPTPGALSAPNDALSQYNNIGNGAGHGSVVFKLNPSGTSFLSIAQLAGHEHCELNIESLQLDATGNPYIGGNVASQCASSGLIVNPAVMPYGPENDVSTAFVAKLHPDLTAYSNFFLIPGSSTVFNSMAVDGDGSVHLTGFGSFPGMPVANAISGTPVTEATGTQWNFAAKLNPAGLGLVYLTAIDAANDLTTAIAVDTAKNVYVAGGRVVSKITATGTLAAALHSSKDQAALGTAVTFTVVVSGGTSPTGTVKFLDGAATLATANLVSGTATYSTSSLALGSHSITATYSGDTNNSATNSQILTQLILKPLSSTTTLTANSNQVIVGTGVVFTTTVVPSGTTTLPAIGSVTLLDGTTALGTYAIVNLNSSASPYGAPGLTFSISSLALGVHNITAHFNGNNEVAASTSSAVTVTVVASMPPTATLAISPSLAIYTPPATYSIAVTPTVVAPGATVSSVTLLMATGNSSPSPVATMTAPPYTFSQSAVLEGRYWYSAQVTDSAGNTGTSGTSQVLVHMGPKASWISPAAGATIAAPIDASLTGAVTVYNPDPSSGGSTVDVEFLEGLVSTPGSIAAGAMGTSAEFTATYPSIPAGAHTMRAYAQDQYGLSSYSAPVTFKVAQPTGTVPFVAAWSGIGSGQTVAAGSFQLEVKALSHNAGSLYTFQLYEGGLLIQRFQATFIGTVGSVPGVSYSFPVATTPGQHTYVAIVSDQTGTSSSTGPVVVNAVAGSVGPTVGIDSPTNGTQFAAGSSITIAGNAWAGSNPIKKMDYYNGSTLLTSVSDGSTALTWPSVPAGVYTLTVVATDTANVSTRSAPVTIYVGGPVFGAITSPADGSVFTAPGTINLTASASTVSTATISHVDYYLAGTLVQSLTTAPYAYSATGLAAGYYQYTAKIYDSAGNTMTSAPVTVEVATLATGGGTTTTTTYLLSDVAGSPIAATDASGHVLWRESYKPFGDRTVNAKTASSNRQFFHGKAADPESGLSYFGARYYDPVIGRFMAPDPAGFQEGDIQSFGRYAYGDNNPYRYRDPDGHSPIDLIFLAVDVAKLGYAVYKGDGVGSALIDVSMSAAGVLIPIPGAGEAMKAARAIEHTAEAVRGAEHSAEAVAKVARSCGCFVAGTPVATESGTVPIEQVSVGMLVMARDEATGVTALKPVTQVFHYEGREIYGVVLLDDQGKATRLEVTDDHPFKVPGHGWVLSRNLHPGTLLESLGHGGLKVVHLEDMGRTQPTFNFEVADSHTFFVGDAGVLVHNEGPCALARTELHHSDPQFLGGQAKQKLTEMSSADHHDLHNEMGKFLRSKEDEFGNHMRPQSNNSGAKIRSNFDRNERLNALSEFYKGVGSKFKDAAQDFFSQHPGLQ